MDTCILIEALLRGTHEIFKDYKTDTVVYSYVTCAFNWFLSTQLKNGVDW